MKSTKQRRREIKSDRLEKTAKRAERLRRELVAIRAQYIDQAIDGGAVAVGHRLAEPGRYLSLPEFLVRGTYLPMHFACMDCGKEDIWTAHQQKWWYEVALGDPFSIATRCRPCRAKERARKIEARRVHLDGIALKKRALPKT